MLNRRYDAHAGRSSESDTQGKWLISVEPSNSKSGGVVCSAAIKVIFKNTSKYYYHIPFITFRRMNNRQQQQQIVLSRIHDPFAHSSCQHICNNQRATIIDRADCVCVSCENERNLHQDAKKTHPMAKENYAFPLPVSNITYDWSASKWAKQKALIACVLF